MHISVSASLILALGSSIYPKNLLATDSSAALGHGGNQSSVQQLTSEGNFLQRTRRASPTGDIHKTM